MPRKFINTRLRMILMNGLDLVLQLDLMDDTTMLSFNLMMEALLCIPIHGDSRILDLIPIGEEAIHPLLESLGPEPFDDWNARHLAQRLHKKTTNIKVALLDQRIVVGVGNIYACEALHRSGIHPQRQSKTLVRKDGRPTKKLDTLVEMVVEVLEQAVEVGGSSLNDFADVNGTLGYFGHHFQVYDREDEPCLKAGCGGTIERITQSGRSTFLCPSCQR